MTWRGRERGSSHSDASVARRHRPDYKLVALMGVLLLLGYVVLYAISFAQVEAINAAGNELTQMGFMLRQALYLLIGVGGFVVASVVALTLWQRHAAKILGVALGVCFVLAVLGVFETWPALCASGACRWFDVGFGTFQPSEFLKFGILLFASVFLGKRMLSGKVNDVKETIFPLAVIVGTALVFVVMFQRDLGTGVVLLAIVASMFFVAGINKKNGLVALATLLLLGAIMVAVAPHRIERITTFFGGEAVSDSDAGYHIEQAQTAIGSGGMFGVGLGKGTSAFGYLPEAVNDSIFAIMGELFGFVGLLAVLGLLVALLLRLLKIMDRLDDPPMKLLVAGVFGWIATHMVVNVGAMIGILPLTGLTLPLLSFGGTSLLFIMIALGLVFQVSRYTQHGTPGSIGQKERDTDENIDGWRRVRRTRHTGRRRNS